MTVKRPTKRQLRHQPTYPKLHPNPGQVCGWCGCHYFGPLCPFTNRHEEAAGW